MSEALAASPDANALLFSEFALTRHVAHPQVVNLYSFEIDRPSQRAFITMELLRGPALDKLLCEQPTGLHGEALSRIVLPLLEALACCHARGVFHGDLKPSNVMLADDGVRLYLDDKPSADSPVAALVHRVIPGWTEPMAWIQAAPGVRPVAAPMVITAVMACLARLARRCGSSCRRTSRRSRSRSGWTVVPVVWPARRASLARVASPKAAWCTAPMVARRAAQGWKGSRGQLGLRVP